MPAAGPSSRKQKKRQGEDGSSAKPAKLPRIDADEDLSDVDMPTGPPTQDPMLALEEAERAGVPDGPVDEADGIVPGMAPVRADEFSTEAEREVDATKGLSGDASAEEGKMKLVHQVRHQVCPPSRSCTHR